jgi:exonuclease SbcC
LSRAGDAIDKIDEVQRGSASLRERAEAARKAHAVCHGRNDVNLLRWVLGQQLDQVAAVASAHLRQMSSGRYGIRRNDEEGGLGAKGLDLRIDDAHTGRSREPRSLSGGEQFQASLALALGLADVVSRAGSARSHSPEALFIDEGFGSLDQSALDEAIGTLHGLQEQGRMVGVITHVEAMKERLHPGIVVERRPDGRGSELTVNP